MRLKRRKDLEGAADEQGVFGPPPVPREPVPDLWTSGPPAPAAEPDLPELPDLPEPETEPDPIPDPAPEPAPSYVPEPVLEGEAFEIPDDAYGFASQSSYEPPVSYGAPFDAPAAMPFPAAEEPIAMVAPERGPERVTALGDAAEQFASGHGPSPAPAWPEGLQELAAERPEVIVGAAFAGGILAAMILRRLGN